MTTQKKAVFAISRRERSNLGVNCEIAALRSRRQRKSCAFHRAPSSWSEAKDREVIFTVEMLHCVQHDNSSKPSLMAVMTQSVRWYDGRKLPNDTVTLFVFIIPFGWRKKRFVVVKDLGIFPRVLFIATAEREGKR